MRSWWKAVAEAWLRHAVPMDMDPSGAFRFPEEPRKEGAALGHLEPTVRCGTGPSCPTPDWTLSYQPPAA